jgi:hypothetical protein
MDLDCTCQLLWDGNSRMHLELELGPSASGSRHPTEAPFDAKTAMLNRLDQNRLSFRMCHRPLTMLITTNINVAISRFDIDKEPGLLHLAPMKAHNAPLSSEFFHGGKPKVWSC